MFGKKKTTMQDVSHSQTMAELEATAFRNESAALRLEFAQLSSEIAVTMGEIESFSKSMKEAVK